MTSHNIKKIDNPIPYSQAIYQSIKVFFTLVIDLTPLRPCRYLLIIETPNWKINLS